MPPTYTTNLGIHKPATGEEAGTWGNVANINYDILDTGIDGNVSIPMSASGYTLTTGHDAVSTGNNKVITFTGALSATGTITISPNTLEKIYYIRNLTTGGFALNIQQGGGGAYVLPNGYAAIVYSDGLGNGASVKGAIADLHLNSLMIATNLIVQGQVTWGGGSATIGQPATFSAAVTMSAGVTISPSLILNLGGDQPYDMHYRSAATDGHLARLANGSSGSLLVATTGGPGWITNGAPGQVLTAGAGGPSWVTPTPPVPIGVGSPIAGATPLLVFVADPSRNLAQDSNFIWNAGEGLGIGMSPTTALCIGHNMPASIILDAAVSAGVTPPGRAIFFSSNGSTRWQLSTVGDKETGSPANAGSSLSLAAFNDNGSLAFATFCCFRSGARVTFGAAVDWGAQVAIIGQVTTQVTLMTRGAASQTADVQQWFNGAGTMIAKLDINGEFWARSYGNLP